MVRIRKPLSRYLTALVGLSLLLQAFVYVPQVIAQLAPAGQAPVGGSGAVTATPGRVELTLSPEIRSQARTVTLTNSYDQPVRLSATLQAIDELSNRIVPAGELPAYLRNSFTLSETDINIPPKGTKTLIVQATDSQDLVPGGHYAALVITPFAAGTAQTGVSNVKAAICISVFLVKQAKDVAPSIVARIEGWPKLTFRLPEQVTVQFTNQGKAHGIPRAALRLQASDGQVLSKATTNASSAILLPGRSVGQQIKLDSIDHPNSWLPQKTALVVDYRAEGSDQVISLAARAWYIPVPFVVSALTVLLLVGVLIWRYHSKLTALLRRPKADVSQQSSDERPKSIDGVYKPARKKRTNQKADHSQTKPSPDNPL